MISVFVATSVDGFIAREDGGLDWLVGEDATETNAGGEDYGYLAFLSSVDAVVMGRHTYEHALTFGAWPLADTPVVVLTSRALTIPAPLRGRVETMSARPAEVIDRLARRGLVRLYVDGGNTVQRFLAAGLVDRLYLTRVPVLLGRGVPLFGSLPAGDVRLRHVATRSYATGLVQSEYATDRTRR